MKRSAIFWGIAFITSGILFLLRQFDLFTYEIGSLLDLWPVLLIIIGVSLLKIPEPYKKLMSGLAGFLLALLITGLVSKACNFDFSRSHHLRHICLEDNVTRKTLPYDSSATKGMLVFKAGAGDFRIAGSSDDLIEVMGYGDVGYIETTDSSQGANDIFYKANNFNIKDIKDNGREALIALNGRVLWDMDISVGAANFEADLSEYYINNLSLSSTGADIDLRIGARSDSIHLFIDSRASGVKIRIPENSGCKVKCLEELSSLELGKRFNLYKDSYRSANFDTATSKIYIELSSAVSGIDFEWY